MTTIGFPQISRVAWAVIKGDIVGQVGKTIVFSGAVDEGNSGGPLMKEGQVIGVVTEVTEQFAYAIPTLIAQYVVRGWVTIEEGTADKAAIQDGAASFALFAFVAIMIFFWVLVIGFAYEWVTGALDWVRAVPDEPSEMVRRSLPSLPEEPFQVRSA